MTNYQHRHDIFINSMIIGDNSMITEQGNIIIKIHKIGTPVPLSVLL